MLIVDAALRNRYRRAPSPPCLIAAVHSLQTAAMSDLRASRENCPCTRNRPIAIRLQARRARPDRLLPSGTLSTDWMTAEHDERMRMSLQGISVMKMEGTVAASSCGGSRPGGMKVIEQEMICGECQQEMSLVQARTRARRSQSSEWPIVTRVACG